LCVGMCWKLLPWCFLLSCFFENNYPTPPQKSSCLLYAKRHMSTRLFVIFLAPSPPPKHPPHVRMSFGFPLFPHFSTGLLLHMAFLLSLFFDTIPDTHCWSSPVPSNCIGERSVDLPSCHPFGLGITSSLLVIPFFLLSQISFPLIYGHHAE